MKQLLKMEIIIEPNVLSKWIAVLDRGYHYFKSFWETPIDSVLVAKPESNPQSLIHEKYVIISE